MSSKVQKFNVKSSVTPIIKKINDHPKKWLGNEKSASQRVKRDIVIIHKKTDHTYANVDYRTTENAQRKDENVTVVDVPFDASQSDKLRLVIDNFDKILDEYSKVEDDPVAASRKPATSKIDTPVSCSKKETKIPKLVKAKTCSIIESKCILKKTNSQPSGTDGLTSSSGLKNKTKSLVNLAKNVKLTESSKQQLGNEWNRKTPPIKKQSDEETKEDSQTNVKAIVKRLNSLTDTNDGEASIETSPTHSISKAKSTMDLSSHKKLTVSSRIPVNTSLRKTYPSIPCDLNNLDPDRSSAGTKKPSINRNFAKSTHNLLETSTSKLSIPKQNRAIHGSTQNIGLTRSGHNFGKSCHNLNSVARTDKGLTKSTQNLTKLSQFRTLEKSAKTKSVHNISNRLPNTGLNTVTEKFNNNPRKLQVKANSVKNLAETFDTRKGTNSKGPTPNPKLAEILPPKLEKNVVSKSLEKLISIGNAQDFVDPEDTFIVLKSPKENVKNVIQKLEDIKNHDKPSSKPIPPTTGTSKNSILKNTDCFGLQKSQVETKFAEKSATMTKSAPKKKQVETIKLNLRRTQDFLEKLETDPNDTVDYYLDPRDFIEDTVDVANCIQMEGKQIKSDITVNGLLKKVLDYYSDNSDDSGNISNEIELDCDDTNSSLKSSESLTTVLDVIFVGQESGIDLSKDTSIEGQEKIFFRDGVVAQLEGRRDERLAGSVERLQARCRGHLARRRLGQRRLQDLAVRCVQRNVRKFMAVRDWPWWRLLVRVTPLLNVHRTEEELRLKTDELETMKVKLEKLENERTKLKHDNDKLETKLSEMTADLAEEHSTSTLAAERLDAETSERLRLEKELAEVQQRHKQLQQSSERLEMELLYARSDLDAVSEEEEDGGGGDGDGGGGVYKQRYERAVKELEFTKRRLHQQHEDDLEQLIGLKKQLEKKLADSYEEVEEQRQVVGQWKRKVQKLNGEMNDLRMLLEEQNGRNNSLEKKQRKFDSETQMLNDELKKERQAKDRLAREKEVCIAEKFATDSMLADTRLELELKEERLASLQREFDEVTCGGRTEEEVTVLRKHKIDCDRRLHDQEEELDELAGQVQLLEQAKLRLEMTLESMRKEAKKETQAREEELEEVRGNAQKKVKALEQQLENEHEERTLLLREKHELERRLASAAESDRHDRAGEEALLHRLKRDLKRTKALLRDTQAQLERQKAETPGKAMIRQLRNQIEDLECARSVAVKTKQSLEADLLETQSLLEEAHRQKQESDERANGLLREKGDLQLQLEENEEELAEVLKKFKGTVQQMSLDQLALQEQVSLVSELEIERNQLKEQLAELTSRLESVESMGDASSNLLVKRSELKVKELESKLELEQTTRSRLEVQISRLKEAVEKLQNEIGGSRSKEQQAQDQIRKLQRQLREIKEELNKSIAKESEVILKKKDLEKRCESLEAEAASARTDLRLALKRIEDLQSAIQGDMEDTISDNTDSEQDTYSSDDSVNTFLSNNKLSSPKMDKNSIVNDIRRLSGTSRSSTSGNLGRESSYT